MFNPLKLGDWGTYCQV